MQRLPKTRFNKLLQFILPDSCQSCGRIGNYLCDFCLITKIRWRWVQLCHVCKSPSYAGLVHHDCKEKTHLDGVIVCCEYEGVVQEMIRKLKYGFYYKLAESLAELMSARYVEQRNLFERAHLTFVPLSSRRQRWRGYNQAELIAQNVGKLSSLKVRQLLRRCKYTESQVGLDRSARLRNLKEVFTLEAPIAGRKVVIIDDVITTGATLEECASVLKQAGASEVYGLVLASG